MATRRPTFRGHLRGDRAAVSDVLGALMMVGITVIAAAGFGLLLFSFDGPADTQHSRLTASVTAGAGDWGDGDEELRLTHVGGEPLDRSKATIIFTTPSGTTTLTGTSLDFGPDGKLLVGETWTRVITADVGDPVSVRFVVTGEQSQLLTSSSIVAGASATAICLGDVTPPLASYAQSPPDLNSTSSGPVTVTATVRDGCSGVVDTPVPHLFWCIAVTCAVPADYTDAGAMTPTGSPGSHQWSLNVPHTGSWLPDAVAGRSLRYYLSPVTDANSPPNSGATAVRSDFVDLIATYTYVVSASASTGSVANLTNANSPPASQPDGLEATLKEGPVTGGAGTGGPSKFSGTTATTSGGVNPNNALGSDDARAVLDATNEYVEVNGIDLPSNAATVTSVVVGYEGRKSANAGTNPTTRIDYKLDAGGTISTGSVTTESSTTDTDRTRTLSGITTVAQAESLYVRIVAASVSNRNVEVDHVFVTVAYTTTAQTNYVMDIQLEWSGLPSGTVNNVELRYRATGDTFAVYPWDFSTSAWRTTPCTGTLSSAVLATFSCSLTANEVSGAEARIRITDSAPTGLTQGQLFLDHARVATA